MSKLILALMILAPLASTATSYVPETAEDVAIQKTKDAVTQNDLKFVTSPTQNICGSTNKEGTDVLVQIADRSGHFVTIRHYGVTYEGMFGRLTPPVAIECVH